MRIGIIGAGMIGATVGKLWVDAGHEVRLASRHPEELKSLAGRLGGTASAGTAKDAAEFGEVVMLSVPLIAIPELARDVASLLAGKIVLDTGNAYANRDGAAAGDATAHAQGSAGWAAAMFPGARWAQLVRDAGFDPVIAGPLARGKEFEPGSKPYNTGMSGPEVRKVLGLP
jgi:8-hydroxy-5-deazaflavin:NADPH oxidoreductase